MASSSNLAPVPARRETLASILSIGPLPVALALTGAIRIASQLRALHARGNCHGRVSAEYVELDSAGATLIAAPPAATSWHADVRSFGALFYQMLTGLRPPADAPFVLSKPRREDCGLLPALQQVALRCLVREPLTVPTMQHVQLELRLHALLAKSCRPHGEPKPAVAPQPPASPPSETTAPAPPPSPDSGATCPVCRAPAAFDSQPRTHFERLVTSWGGELRRCHRCQHRWLTAGTLRLDRPLP